VDESLIPPDGVEGKTVLDIGDGQGESALLFFTHGASRVVCVEPNHDAANLLRKSVRLNGWNAEVIERPFSPDMLNQLKSDLAKLDCEGAEEALLSLDSLPVSVILEAHGPRAFPTIERKVRLQGRSRRDGDGGSREVLSNECPMGAWKKQNEKGRLPVRPTVIVGRKFP